MTWADTYALIRADIARRFQLEGRAPTLLNLMASLPKPGLISAILYRLKCYLHLKRRFLAVRVVDQLMYYWGRAEIHTGSRIDGGLVLPDHGGVGIPAFAIIGRNCTFTGAALLTLGGMEGVDLKTDRIILGEYCIVGSGVRIIGAVNLANCTQIKPNSVVMTSFHGEGAVLSGIPARRKLTVPAESVMNWSPLQGRSMSRSR